MRCRCSRLLPPADLCAYVSNSSAVFHPHAARADTSKDLATHCHHNRADGAALLSREQGAEKKTEWERMRRRTRQCLGTSSCRVRPDIVCDLILSDCLLGIDLLRVDSLLLRVSCDAAVVFEPLGSSLIRQHGEGQRSRVGVARCGYRRSHSLHRWIRHSFLRHVQRQRLCVSCIAHGKLTRAATNQQPAHGVETNKGRHELDCHSRSRFWLGMPCACLPLR